MTTETLAAPLRKHVRFFAVDPGPAESHLCIYRPLNGEQPIHALTVPNHDLLVILRDQPALADLLCVEMVASYGMSVGREVFETCVWIGRFVEAWGGDFELVPRLEVKMYLCHDSRAKDSNIRRALLDRFGEPGTKKAPGVTYGLNSHQLQALAVGVTVADRNGRGEALHPVLPGMEVAAAERMV